VKNNREEGNNQRQLQDAPGLTMQPPAGKVESIRRGGNKKKVKPEKARASSNGHRKIAA
jgi:hypothetical protein